MLDPEDYRYIRAYDFRIESRLRRKRMTIYRCALKKLAAEVWESYQVRLSDMNAAGCWVAYPRLALSTASMFNSLVKLWMASVLFGFRLPVAVNLAAQRDRLQRFLSGERPSGELPRLTA